MPAKDVHQVSAQHASADGPSFRVYTADDLQHVVLRSAYKPAPERGLAEELKESLSEGIERVRTTDPRTIGKWAAIALGASTILFAGILALANATDDTVRSKSDRHASSKLEIQSFPVTSTSTTPNTPSLGTDPTKTPPVASSDFEVGADAPVPRSVAAKPRRVPKRGKRNPGAMTIRTPPF